MDRRYVEDGIGTAAAKVCACYGLCIEPSGYAGRAAVLVNGPSWAEKTGGDKRGLWPTGKRHQSCEQKVSLRKRATSQVAALCAPLVLVQKISTWVRNPGPQVDHSDCAEDLRGSPKLALPARLERPQPRLFLL